MPQRSDNAPARDTSLLPTGERVLEPLVLDDDLDHTLDLSGVVALELLLVAGGAYVEGEDAPDQAKNPQRAAASCMDVSGLTAW